MNLDCKKRKLIIGLILIIMIILIFFISIYYKNKITGNNINIKNNEDIIAYVKNIKNYKANLDVTIYSNKNETKYKIYQEVKNDKSIQIIKEPKEIENLTIEKENNQVIIKNTNLKLEKIYTDYSEYLSNLLCLDSIVKQIKNENIKVKEEGNTVVLQLENYEKNTYGKYIEIYFNKETKKIEKIEIKDKNQKTRICILYTDIEIN
jgi:outer membrane lipoprotein-sorting protein